MQFECHAVFDRLWCGPDAPMLRSEAYKYLGRILRRPIHMAHIALLDMRDCLYVIRRVQQDYEKLFRKSA